MPGAFVFIFIWCLRMDDAEVFEIVEIACLWSGLEAVLLSDTLDGLKSFGLLGR
jgi:hypothetical protein